MFDPKSRYFSLEQRMIRSADGSELVYKARRILPPVDSVDGTNTNLPVTTVKDGERLDTVAARELGEPLAFWRIADANRALNPFSLTRPGTQLLIPNSASQNSGRRE